MSCVRYALLLILPLAISLPAKSQVATVAKNIEGLRSITRQVAARDVVQELNKLTRNEQNLVIRAIRIDPRIVGGEPADIASFPHQVALVRGYAAEPYRSQFCGGSLIAADVVLTAAHCIDNGIVRSDPARVDVVAGATVYKSGGERLKVEAVFVHPQWDAKSQDYDFAVLKLKTPSSLGRPVPIDQTAPQPPSELYVSGWGAISESGPGSDDLLAAKVPLVDNITCADAGYGTALTPRMMCAGYRDGGVDSCQGDSGGPLVEGTVGSWRLVGVVSWGEGCARRMRYGVYSRVSEVVPWLRSLSSVRVAEHPALNQLASRAAR